MKSTPDSDLQEHAVSAPALTERSGRRWLDEERWTLVTAAHLLHGLEPPAHAQDRGINAEGGPDRFDDRIVELRERLLRAVRSGTLPFGASAANPRWEGCKPDDVIAWAIVRGIESPACLLRMGDFSYIVYQGHRNGLPTSSTALLPGLCDKAGARRRRLKAGEMTVEEAAIEIGDANGVSVDGLVDEMFAAQASGKLTMRKQETGLPYAAGKARRSFHDLVCVPDINAWLESSGARFRFPAEVAPPSSGIEPSQPQGAWTDEGACTLIEILSNGDPIDWDCWATLRTISAVQAVQLRNCIDPDRADPAAEVWLADGHRGDVILRHRGEDGRSGTYLLRRSRIEAMRQEMRRLEQFLGSTFEPCALLVRSDLPFNFRRALSNCEAKAGASHESVSVGPMLPFGDTPFLNPPASHEVEPDPADRPDELDIANQLDRALTGGYRSDVGAYRKRGEEWFNKHRPDIKGAARDRILGVVNRNKTGGRPKGGG